MRYRIMTTIALVVALGVNAQCLTDYQVIRSKASDDLILQVSIRKTHGILYSTSSIEYGWFTVTNKNCMVNLPKDEFFSFVQMFDSAGNAIPLQGAFTNLGKHFFDLKYPSTEQPGSAIEEMLRIRPPHGTQSAAGEIVFAGQKSMEGRSFYDLEHVFQIKKPGQYKVRLEFQAYERIYKGGQSFAYKLERFEPVEFTVIKE